MPYFVRVNKKFSYVRVYTITKSVKGQTNAFSRYIEGLLQKYLSKNNRPANGDVAK